MRLQPVRWNSDERSANPTPVCRKGGCPEPAEDGEEWCTDHGFAVAKGQEHAAVQLAAVSGRGHRKL